MGIIWDWKGPTTAFLVSAVMGATAAALLLIFVKSQPEPPEQPVMRSA
jgi:hypothetical protein